MNDSDDEYDEEGAEYLEMLNKKEVSSNGSMICVCYKFNLVVS